MMHRRFFQRTTLQQDNPNNHTLFQMPDFFVAGPVVIPKSTTARTGRSFSRRLVPH
jgi:hypothetical protein